MTDYTSWYLLRQIRNFDRETFAVLRIKHELTPFLIANAHH